MALAGTACTQNQIQIETDSAGSGNQDSSTGNSSASVGMTLDPDSGSDDGPVVPFSREADILLVIDNSGSMGEEQATIARTIDGLVDALDSANPPVDYRIGVTTTDNGNPWCQGTGPEAGMLRATSCRARPTEFVFQGAQTIDATQEACYDVCTMENLQLPNPWVEVNGSTGTSNVPGNQVKDTLRCMLPQGINGCGFESPLESAWKALRRSSTEGDESFGFLRDGALPVVVFISDEGDCSYNNEWETIFLPDGERVFWSDQSAPAPTSAVCWNAGVACNGNGVYDDCFPIDLDAGGNQVSANEAPDRAVLRPISRYVDEFRALGVFTIAINGVNPDGVPMYADSLEDPQFQSDFGIGPGCSSVSGQAVPPVRLRQMVAEVSGTDAQNLFSICDPDYSPAFSALANGILQRLP